MTKLYCFCLASLLVSLTALAHAAEPCVTPTLISPAEGETSTRDRPTVSWLPQGEDAEFEIELIAYVPEGEVLNRVQRLVKGSNWALDSPLAHQDAIIIVRLKRHCGTATSAVATRVFNLRAKQQCPVPIGIHTSNRRDFIQLEWHTLPLIQKVEAIGFAGPKAKPSARESFEKSPALIRLGSPRPDLIGVRSICQSGFSDWSWIPVATP